MVSAARHHPSSHDGPLGSKKGFASASAGGSSAEAEGKGEQSIY